MQRQILALAGALCAGLFMASAPIAAQSSMGSQSLLTGAQVTAKLQAAGYTNVHDVEREGDHYDADAVKDGRAVHMHVDRKTGAITPAKSRKRDQGKRGARAPPALSR